MSERVIASYGRPISTFAEEVARLLIQEEVPKFIAPYGREVRFGQISGTGLPETHILQDGISPLAYLCPELGYVERTREGGIKVVLHDEKVPRETADRIYNALEMINLSDNNPPADRVI